MNSFRLARAAVRARPSVMRMAAQRRGYADAVPDKVCPATQSRLREIAVRVANDMCHRSS